MVRIFTIGLISFVATGCDWLLVEYSNYSDVKFSDIDPASFNNNPIDNSINPYIQNPKNIQIAQYFAGGNHNSENSFKEIINEIKENGEIVNAVTEAGGVCLEKNLMLECVYNKIVWPLDLATGERNDDHREGVCLHYQFSYFREKGIKEAIDEFNYFSSAFKIYSDYGRKELIETCQLKGWVDGCELKTYPLKCKDREPRAEFKKSRI